MRFATIAGFVSLPGALAMLDLRRSSFEALAGLDRRQFQFCGSVPEGTPNPCAVACGPGNQICISLPTCFNPQVGETCCSNGQYCPAGSYCSDVGCCDNGISLEECGATQIIATVPGIDNIPGSTVSTPSSSSTPTPTPPSSSTYTTPTPPSSSSSTTESSTSSASSSYTPPVATPPATPSTPSNATVTSQLPPPASYTGTAGKNEVAGWVLGGMAVLGMGFML